VDKRDREALVAECRASGKTAKAWCEAKGIQYRQYVAWATKLNRDVHRQKPQEWADVTIAKEERVTDEIKLICGKWTICVGTGFIPALLADILKVVDAIC
jgi:hypothetical protein